MKRKILSVLLALCMVLGMLPGTARAAVANGTCGENLTWTLDDEEGTLTISGTGAMTHYTISTVTNPAPWYSYAESIKSVEIGNGVTSIGNYAFYGCSKLISITIPNSVTSIGNYAFQDCNTLLEVTIPGSVESIGDAAFLGCANLSSIMSDAIKSSRSGV